MVKKIVGPKKEHGVRFKTRILIVAITFDLTKKPLFCKKRARGFRKNEHLKNGQIILGYVFTKEGRL